MLGDVFIAIGAAVLMIFAMLSTSLNNNNICLWLGKISYSTYLSHRLVFTTCIIFFYAAYGGVITAIVTIIGTLVLAYIINMLIEMPSIKLSRYFYKQPSAKMKSSPNNIVK